MTLELLWKFKRDAIYLRSDGLYELQVDGNYVMAARSLMIVSNYLYMEFGR